MRGAILRVSLVSMPSIAGVSVGFAFGADGAGRYTIRGTAHADHLSGTGGGDVICLLGGDDESDAGAGDDVVYAGRGDDLVDGEGGGDRLLGQAGEDNLTGSGGPDVLKGGRSSDPCLDAHDGAGSDNVDGGPGRNLAYADSRDRVVNARRVTCIAPPRL